MEWVGISTDSLDEAIEELNRMIKDIYEWLETGGQNPSDRKVELALKLIEEELDELKEAWVNGDRAGVLDAVVDLYWVVTNTPFFAGEPLEEVLSYVEKVSISNWSKFCKNEKEAIDTMEAYMNGTHPDKIGQVVKCYYERSPGNMWWIVKREDGKILKSLNYYSVDKL